MKRKKSRIFKDLQKSILQSNKKIVIKNYINERPIYQYRYYIRVKRCTVRLFKTFLKSFKTTEYDEISDVKLKTASLYFLKILGFSFVIMCILAIPLLMQLQNTIQSQLSAFDTLSFSAAYTQHAPVTLGDPAYLSIDTQSNKTFAEQGILITSQNVGIKKLFFEKSIDLVGFSNVLEHKDAYTKAVLLVSALLLPSILLGLFIWYMIKFTLFILFISLIALIIARVSRYEIGYKIILNTAIFATSFAILVELITTPLQIHIPYINIEWIGYLISVILFTLAIREQGFWDNKRQVKPKKRGYLDYE